MLDEGDLGESTARDRPKASVVDEVYGSATPTVYIVSGSHDGGKHGGGEEWVDGHACT